jgi:hypothetical protein
MTSIPLALAAAWALAAPAAAGEDVAAAALDALYDGFAAESADPALDDRIEAALEAARPALVKRVRRLKSTALITSVDRVLASYAGMMDTAIPAELTRETASDLVTSLAISVRFADLETTRAVAPVYNVIAALDLTVTKRRDRKEVPEHRLSPDELRTLLSQRTRELLQLDYELVGAAGLRTDRVEATTAGKKLAGFEADPSVGLIRLAMRRLVALGHDEVVDPRRGTGTIVSVP